MRKEDKTQFLDDQDYMELQGSIIRESLNEGKSTKRIARDLSLTYKLVLNNVRSVLYTGEFMSRPRSLKPKKFEDWHLVTDHLVSKQMATGKAADCWSECTSDVKRNFSLLESSRKDRYRT